MKVEDKLRIIKDSCKEKKGIDIKVLDIKGLSSIADYFVIVSGNSVRQVSALADEIEEKMDEKGINLENIDGKTTSRWILLDYGDIIVHVFHKDEREYYDIERLWSKDEEENGNFKLKEKEDK
ncbi:ribosome silencing factor [Peptoniphilus lacrimalis]|uniref:Ribosomal silencing factor RsfS n=2 Tax=Peptoniphilus lacrimalis TaxID=33031 RepID=D1VUN0_9FIRM|nr:ribosome silencing factor [Peptoniphilus lacrimalis]EFA89764.1 iojap-like protein [Peptoniphilus lacrimalis 315-B]MDK7721627.1 ribosome silencing factor [Peptoniphilus lacrimalis]MDK7731229.1 ribosome silencing factor [Peptoniphilus lacrimalis]MDK8281645.1 ribosome silencing factor [Peptoniphilus lacrimalis]SUB57558.1 ribosome-associated protein [Peptoniphilus lacrimalis]